MSDLLSQKLLRQRRRLCRRYLGEASATKCFKEGKSAASFCHRVAAWFPDMFCKFCLVKNHKIAENSMAT
jgi:hypothetical protein